MTTPSNDCLPWALDADGKIITSSDFQTQDDFVLCRTEWVVDDKCMLQYAIGRTGDRVLKTRIHLNQMPEDLEEGV